MRSLVRVVLVLLVHFSLIDSHALADFPPTIEAVVRQADALVASGAGSPHEVADSVLRLRSMAAQSEGQAPSELLRRLAAQLEPFALPSDEPPAPQGRLALLRDARATLDLLTRKLTPPGAAPGVAVASAAALAAAPANDDCGNPAPLAEGFLSGSTGAATTDGGASCGDSATSPDVWYSYTAAGSGLVSWHTFGSTSDTVLSVHSACPDEVGDHELVCSDDAQGSLASLVAREMTAGETVLVRVSGASGASGAFRLTTDSSAGGIAGTVTKSGTGEARSAAEVSVFGPLGGFVAGVMTESDGTYLIGGLEAGDFFVRVRDELLISEVWQDLPCVVCDPTAIGDPVTVTSGLVSGVDFSLEPAGTITGTVSAADVGALPFVALFAYDSGGLFSRGSFSDAFGRYWIGGLTAGTYTVRTSNFGHTDELYDDLPCRASCDVTTGTPIEVGAGSTVEGIDFLLLPLGSISGTVSRSQNGSPVDSTLVQIFDQTGTVRQSGRTAFDGSYRVGRLDAGNYYATTVSFDLLDELYHDLPCTPACSVTSGTPIAVEVNTETVGIDFALDEPSRIEGRVLDEEGVFVLSGDVLAYDSSGAFVSSGFFTDGVYRVDRLSPGEYFLRTTTNAWSPIHEDLLYPDIGCEPDCDVVQGVPIPVGASSTTSGIDFVLPRCTAISHTVVSEGEILGAETHKACRTIDVGPDVVVRSTGELVLRAGRSVAFRSGFTVAVGGRLQVVIGPVVGFD